VFNKLRFGHGGHSDQFSGWLLADLPSCPDSAFGSPFG
jgi:hypothetical protein